MASVISVIATSNGKETDGSSVVFSFSRTGDTSTPLNVSYQLFGTAQAGSDYTGKATGTVSFAAGSSSATLSLPALADGALIDPGETIIARINPATNYEIAAGKQFATATITAEGMVVAPNVVTRIGWSTGEKQNNSAYAALKSDGTVSIWGQSWNGSNWVATEAPSGLNGVSQIFSNGEAFAALKSDGTAVTWGSGGTGATGLAGISKIFSTESAFSALTSDGTVISWGNKDNGGSAPKALNGVVEIFSNDVAFAALKSDGTVTTWGDSTLGGAVPSGLTGVTKIFSNPYAFAALKSDGTVVAWGSNSDGGSVPALLSGVIDVASSSRSFAALKNDGTVVSWGSHGYAPTGLSDVSRIFSSNLAFAALKTDGTVVAWGEADYGGNAPNTLSGVRQIFSSNFAFAALKDDGSVSAWGNKNFGGEAPLGLSGVTNIFSNGYAFAALKSDGTVTTWGDSTRGGTAPVGLSGVTNIFFNSYSFVALKNNGSIVTWGDSTRGGIAPAGLTNVVGFANPYTDDRLILEDKTTPTYTLTPSATTINEGSTLTTSVATTNVASATTLYYSLSGTGITAADFSAGALTGEGTTDSAGKFTFSHTLANDLTTEGAETVEIKLYSDSARTLQVGATATVIVADTSINPFNSGAATFTVSGTVLVGQALKIAKTADDPDGNGTFSYQWQSSTDGTTWGNIGANAFNYTLTSAEQATQIRVQVSYIDAQAFTEKITVAVGTVGALNDGAATFSIFGNNGGTAVYIVGQRLLVEKIATDPDSGHGAPKYQWQSSTNGNIWSNIGINNEFYTLTNLEQAKQIRVQVSYTDGEGFKEEITVVGGFVPIVKEPIITISGNYIQSSTLTANVQFDPDTPYLNSTFIYTWYANKEIIAAQTTKTLVLTDDLVGKRISATASYTNSAGQSASISTAEKQVQAGFINSKGIEVKADVRLGNSNLEGALTTINATTNPNAKKAVDALKAKKVELSPTMVNFTIALPSNPTKPTENETSASIAIGIDLVSDGISLSTGTGAAAKQTPLAYYSVDSAGVASPFTYDPVSKTGANFYDTSLDGKPDLVTLAFVDGGRGDRDGIKNGKIVDPSTIGTVNVSPVLANFKDSLLIADPLSDLPAALIVKAKLMSRAATVNEIGYVVLDKGETINSIGFAELAKRAQILFAGLESSDVPNLSSFSFDKSIALVNGQSIGFFETTDSSLKELAKGKSSVAALGSSFKILSTTIDSSSATKASSVSSSGMNFSLEIAGSFAGLDSLIGVNQADLPILDFSAISGMEVTADISLAREAMYNSTVGFYRILGIDGSVKDLTGKLFLPGDSGYKEAALASSNLSTSLKDLSISNSKSATNEFKIKESGLLAPYAIVSGVDAYFAYSAANADLISHFKILGTNVIGLEDIGGGGDNDFDDLVIGIKSKSLAAI